MADLSVVDQYYIPEIVTLLGAIQFDSSTLGAKNLINGYEQSIKDKPNTTINVTSDYLGSSFLESKLNKRIYNIKIKIYTNAENRELKAQQDMSYLEEQIIDIIENNLETLQSTTGFEYTNNDRIQAAPRAFFDNFYIKEIPWQVSKIVAVTN